MAKVGRPRTRIGVRRQDSNEAMTGGSAIATEKLADGPEAAPIAADAACPVTCVASDTPSLQDALNKIRVIGVLSDGLGLGDVLQVLFNLVGRSGRDEAGNPTKANADFGDHLSLLLQSSYSGQVEEDFIGYDSRFYSVAPNEGIPLVYNGPVVKLKSAQQLTDKTVVFGDGQKSQEVSRAVRGV